MSYYIPKVSQMIMISLQGIPLLKDNVSQLHDMKDMKDMLFAKLNDWF